MKKHICTHCGEEFTGKKRKYCNDKCRHEYDKVRKRKQYRLDNNIKSRSCPICDKEFEPNRNGALTKYCSQGCADEARKISNRERWRRDNPGWDDGTNKVCEWCGQAFTVPARNAHQARFCSSECQQTWYSREVIGNKSWDEHLAIIGEQKHKRQAKLEKERAIRSLRTTLTKIIKLKEEEKRIKDLTRECEECGTTFYNPHPLAMTCSNRCSRRRSNRIKKIKERDRINKHNLVDKGISLVKLYKRDNGICYLCGESCDFNDMEITTHGHYIVGPAYPSIDHVKPLSKGGKHSWRNVKLTHHSCNTNKNDKYVNEYLDEVA